MEKMIKNDREINVLCKKQMEVYIVVSEDGKFISVCFGFCCGYREVRFMWFMWNDIGKIK